MRWLDRGDFTPTDLARYRTIYAVAMLLMLPSFGWAAAFPDAAMTPPPGPFELVDSLPPLWVFQLLEVGVAVCLAALLLNVWPTAAAVAVSVLMALGFGLTFTLGKIDHVILPVIAPLFLAAAGWSGRRAVAPWAMRLFAFTIGLAMASAGLAKLAGGWLDTSTEATRGTLLVYLHNYADAGPLAATLAPISGHMFWEALDWATVLLELSLVVSVVSWRMFRICLAGLAVFHLGVMLMMGIVFAANVVVYAAFVPWGRVRLPEVRFTGRPWMAALLGLAVWVETSTLGSPAAAVAVAIVTTGAAGGALWLVGIVLRETGLDQRDRHVDVTDGRVHPGADPHVDQVVLGERHCQ